jgi:hypothetical protein
MGDACKPVHETGVFSVGDFTTGPRQIVFAETFDSYKSDSFGQLFVIGFIENCCSIEQ